MTYFETTVSGAKVTPPTLKVYHAMVNGSQTDEWLGEAVESNLKPTQLNWSINGTPSTLSLQWNLGIGHGKSTATAAEDHGDTIYTTDKIRLTATVDSTERELFNGYVGQESILIQASPDRESAGLVAYGPEIALKAKAIHGQWHAKPGADDSWLAGSTGDFGWRDEAFQSDLPCVFNVRGLPNASASPWYLADYGTVPNCRVFEAPGRIVKATGSGTDYEAQHWTAFTALHSLLTWYEVGSILNLASFADDYATLLDVPIGEVVVEGKDIIEAMRDILLPVGFGFAITPWQVDGLHQLSIFSMRGASPSAGPCLADNYLGNVSISDPDGQSALVQRLEFLRDGHNCQNELTLVGDQTRTQVELIFDNGTGLLQPAWDTTTYNIADWAIDDVVPDMNTDVSYEGSNAKDPADFIDRFRSSGPDHLDYLNVFRTFAANDDGWLSQYGVAIADFGTYGVAEGSENHYIRRPRPVGRTLIADDGGASWRPAYVQIGIVGDDSSWVLLPCCEVLKDHAGFRITSDKLDQVLPYKAFEEDDSHPLNGYAKESLLTLLHNTLRGSGTKLRFRLVGTIEGDEALKIEYGRLTTSNWALHSTRVVSARKRYKDYVTEYAPTNSQARSDSYDIADAAAQMQDIYEDAMGHGSLVLRTLTTEWTPGTAIGSTTGRVVSFAIDGGAGTYCPIVSGLTFNFQDGAFKTELTLDSPLLKVMV